MSGPEHPGDDPTRRIDPEERDATRPVAGSEWGRSADATRRIDPVEGGAADRAEAAEQPHETAPGEPGRGRHGRGALVATGIMGLLVGVVAAFLLFALGTSDPTEDMAAQERITELEIQLEEREAEIAELEARLAEAEAAAGERDADLEQQRDALEERSRVLDDRQQALDERQAALDDREATIADREARVREAEEDGDGLELDEETARTIVDRIVDTIRDLLP